MPDTETPEIAPKLRQKRAILIFGRANYAILVPSYVKVAKGDPVPEGHVFESRELLYKPVDTTAADARLVRAVEASSQTSLVRVIDAVEEDFAAIARIHSEQVDAHRLAVGQDTSDQAMGALDRIYRSWYAEIARLYPVGG